MGLRLTAATITQLLGLAVFFAGIGVTLYGITVGPQQWGGAGGLEGQGLQGGALESPGPPPMYAAIAVGNYALMGAAIAWIGGTSGIGLPGSRRTGLATLFAACAILGAIGLALVLWWTGTCSGQAACYPTGLRDAGIGLLASFAGLTAFTAISAATTSGRSTPRPAP